MKNKRWHGKLRVQAGRILTDERDNVVVIGQAWTRITVDVKVYDNNAIAVTEADESIHYVAKACNFHDELVKALENLLTPLDEDRLLDGRLDQAYFEAANLLEEIKKTS